MTRTLPELAKAAGVSESTARRYVKTFGDFIPSEGRGRVRVYHDGAVKIVRRIKKLYDFGHDTDGVYGVLRDEFDQVIEVEPIKDSGGQSPAAKHDSQAIVEELVSQLRGQGRAHHDIDLLKRGMHILKNKIEKLQKQQQALPESTSLDDIIDRLEQLEHRVDELERGRRGKFWFRKK